MRKAIVAALWSALITVVVSDAQAPAIVVHDLAALTGRGNAQLKAVVTDDGSVGFALARPGVTQTGHHHQQEQVVLPLEKPMSFTISGSTRTLNKYVAAIPPANTHHFYATQEGDPTPFIEYQPVRRDDWVGLPHKPVQTPEALSLPAGRETVTDLSPTSSGWKVSGAVRTKEFAGEQIKVVMIDLRTPGTSIDVPASAVGRQFFYVLEGKPLISDGTTKRALAAHTVVEMSAASKPIRFESPTEGSALIAMFSRMRE
jgi:hypothetical protein